MDTQRNQVFFLRQIVHSHNKAGGIVFFAFQQNLKRHYLSSRESGELRLHDFFYFRKFGK